MVYENGPAYNLPFNEKDIKSYGLGRKEIEINTAIIELQVKGINQQRQSDFSNIATSEGNMENKGYLSDEAVIESVRL